MYKTKRTEPGIPCPVCGKGSKVIDSRITTRNRIRRRRECLSRKCKERFTSYEAIYGEGDFDGFMIRVPPYFVVVIFSPSAYKSDQRDIDGFVLLTFEFG